MLDAVYIEATICSLDITKVKVVFDLKNESCHNSLKQMRALWQRRCNARVKVKRLNIAKSLQKKCECNIRKTLATNRDL